MPFYASAEQIMRDRSEYARKGIARGRSVVVMRYSEGILMVAESMSPALHKVSEIYDRIGFAAVGRYNEFESLRVAGIRHADLRGYSYDRRDVTARSLANAYSQTLGAIFTEQQKPYEVEICVAEVGSAPEQDQIYRVSYDGTIVDEPEFLAMGGQTDTLTAAMRDSYRPGTGLPDALSIATRALGSVGGENGAQRQLLATQLEVAVLDRTKPGRAFRRVLGAQLTSMLPGADDTPAAPAADTVPAESATEPGQAPGTTVAELPAPTDEEES